MVSIQHPRQWEESAKWKCLMGLKNVEMLGVFGQQGSSRHYQTSGIDDLYISLAHFLISCTCPALHSRILSTLLTLISRKPINELWSQTKTLLDLCYLILTHPLFKFSFLKLLSLSLAFTITPSAYAAYILVAASLTRTVVGPFTPGPLLFSPYCFSCGASLFPIAYTTLITLKFRILDLTSEFLADGCIYCL